jgi:hypothetical protein
MVTRPLLATAKRLAFSNQRSFPSTIFDAFASFACCSIWISALRFSATSLRAFNAGAATLHDI